MVVVVPYPGHCPTHLHARFMSGVVRSKVPTEVRARGSRVGFQGQAKGATAMPIATPATHGQMLRAAKQRGFAFPAINGASRQALKGALRGFADAGSDG